MDTLIKYRKKFKMNQTEVADAIGVSRRAYGSYETGERNPSVQTLKALSKLYGVSLDVLTGNVSEPELFDDARIEDARIQQLFNNLTPHQKEAVKSKIEGFSDVNNQLEKQRKAERCSVLIDTQKQLEKRC